MEKIIFVLWIITGHVLVVSIFLALGNFTDRREFLHRALLFRGDKFEKRVGFAVWALVICTLIGLDVFIVQFNDLFY